jgi:ABC-type antimicrobial peptide transport system permease subunit
LNTLLKSTLRLITKRKGETILLIILGALAVGFLVGVEVDSRNFQVYITNSMTDTLGHISFFGKFNETIPKELSGMNGVRDVKLYYWIRGYTIQSDGTKKPIVLLDSNILNNLLIETTTKPKGTHVLLYKTISGSQPSTGSISIPSQLNVTVYNATNHTWVTLHMQVVSTAKGLPQFSGSSTIVLVVDHNYLQSLANHRPTWLAVWLSNTSDQYIDQEAKKLRRTLEINGYAVAGEWINHPQHNPAVEIIKSLTNYFIPYIIAAVILVAVLSAAGGAAVIGSSTRHIAVIRSLGASKWEVFTVYLVPWILRILGASLLGALVGPFIGKLILKIAMKGDTEILDILYKAYGYQLPLDVIAIYTLIAFLIALAGSLVPGILASRVNLRDALVFYGLKTGRALKVKAGITVLNMSARNLFSKPWKLAGLVLAVTIVWGVASGAYASILSITQENENYWNSMDYDSVIYLMPAAYQVNPDYAKADRVISGTGKIQSIQEVATSTGEYLPRLAKYICVSTIIKGEPISYKPLKGRMPSNPGEVAVSKTLIHVLHKKIGDQITVKAWNSTMENLRIVGVIPDKCNSYVILLTPEGFTKTTGVNLTWGPRILYVKYNPGVNPEETTRLIVAELNKIPSITAEGETKAQLIKENNQSWQVFTGITMGFTLISLITGVGVVAALAAIDTSERRREISVMQALGITPRSITLLGTLEIAIATILSIPLISITGYLITKASLNLATGAIGYIPPHYPAKALIGPPALTAYLVTLFIAALVIHRYIKKINIIETLRAD